MILKVIGKKYFIFCGLLIAKMAKKIQLKDIRKYKNSGACRQKHITQYGASYF